MRFMGVTKTVTGTLGSKKMNLFSFDKNVYYSYDVERKNVHYSCDVFLKNTHYSYDVERILSIPMMWKECSLFLKKTHYFYDVERKERMLTFPMKERCGKHEKNIIIPLMWKERMLTIPIKGRCGKHYSFDMKRTLMRREKMLMMWKEHSLCEKNAHYSFDVKRNIL